MKNIKITGAKQHNLKGIDITIPANSLTVITGLSGSGKSSLAFNTIYAEGQRRYVESLSTYARQFIKQFSKPQVTSILGLSPSISMEQKTSLTSSRSTVGTITEVSDYLRLLYAKIGEAKCPKHKTSLRPQSIENIVNQIMGLKTSIIISAPLIRGKKGAFKKEIEEWKKTGLVKAIIDSQVIDLENITHLNKNKLHYIDLIVDQLIIKTSSEQRVLDSIECALNLTKGFLKVTILKTKRELFFSSTSTCSECNYSFAETQEPRLFSFNDIRGACKKCRGLGQVEKEDVWHKCSSCNGTRLNISARSVFVKNLNIHEMSSFDILNIKKTVASLKLTDKQTQIAFQIKSSLIEKLSFLEKLGVGYLTLTRGSKTLSGGEVQRLRLAAQLTNPLVGILYVLDEPSIGLHPKDHRNLLASLHLLKNKGNTVLIVEHDKDTILNADYVIDLGPGAGEMGGEVIYQGKVAQLTSGLTGLYLKNKRKAYLNKYRGLNSVNWLKIEKANKHNLKNIDVQIPLNRFVAVTGISGSGKSSLITKLLLEHLENYFLKEPKKLSSTKITGANHLDRVIDINQKPIGKTPRSVPATYVDLLSHIRDLFSKLPESRKKGYKPAQFSFNLPFGRCSACDGMGQKKIEFHFMSEVYVECDTCLGKRFNQETLNVKYKNKTITDILNMTVNEALKLFKHHPIISNKLQTLQQVGLDYLRLGQNSVSLSGGEAQRIKLSKELSRSKKKKTIYILDEPTTGLHFEDIKKLVVLLQALVDNGHTVIVIEHNLDVIRSCDYMIDLGPYGGERGGKVVATGHPEAPTVLGKSATVEFLEKGS